MRVRGWCPRLRVRQGGRLETVHHPSGGTPCLVASASAASQPKTLKFHLGKPGKVFAGGTIHLFTGKVPKGTYEIGMSGLIEDTGISGTDSYTCLVADKKDLVRLLGSSNPNANIKRFYAVDAHGQQEPDSLELDSTNPAQKVDRTKIAFGCLFSGDGQFKIKRTVTFTFRAVKVTNESGSPITLTRSGARKLAGLVH